MSYAWALELPTSEKFVAVALADHAHDDGSEARPSQALIAKKTGLSERQVRRSLANLVERGVIELVRGGGHHRPNVYRFTFVRPDTVSALRPDIQTVRPDTQSAKSGHTVRLTIKNRPLNQASEILETDEPSEAVDPEYRRRLIAETRERLNARRW